MFDSFYLRQYIPKWNNWILSINLVAVCFVGKRRGSNVRIVKIQANVVPPQPSCLALVAYALSCL